MSAIVLPASRKRFATADGSLPSPQQVSWDHIDHQLQKTHLLNKPVLSWILELQSWSWTVWFNWKNWKFRKLNCKLWLMRNIGCLRMLHRVSRLNSECSVHVYMVVKYFYVSRAMFISFSKSYIRFFMGICHLRYRQRRDPATQRHRGCNPTSPCRPTHAQAEQSSFFSCCTACRGKLFG